MKRIIVGISGASGAIYGIRLLDVLRGVDDVETHLVLSSAARRTILLETDYSVEEVEAIANKVYRLGEGAASLFPCSFRAGGLDVAPLSLKTPSSHATSYFDTLLLL